MAASFNILNVDKGINLNLIGLQLEALIGKISESFIVDEKVAMRMWNYYVFYIQN